MRENSLFRYLITIGIKMLTVILYNLSNVVLFVPSHFRKHENTRGMIVKFGWTGVLPNSYCFSFTSGSKFKIRSVQGNKQNWGICYNTVKIFLLNFIKTLLKMYVVTENAALCSKTVYWLKRLIYGLIIG